MKGINPPQILLYLPSSSRLLVFLFALISCSIIHSPLCPQGSLNVMIAGRWTCCANHRCYLLAGLLDNTMQIGPCKFPAYNRQ